MIEKPLPCGVLYKIAAFNKWKEIKNVFGPAMCDLIICITDKPRCTEDGEACYAQPNRQYTDKTIGLS